MKKYIIQIEKDDEGNLHVFSESDGFSGIEILGLLEWKKTDIIRQLNGEFKPDIVKRKFVED